ncbi:alpha/beta hydrolase [Galbibacter sp. EGI 63066]|uniref:alpha/beta fold hydrolase n=1 Tax=Galbibacter sp. EGI 63066 TaxID=2993559 RepID=UPI0022490759|nr:alpha/beta hydrolase [Galbibacter sp. EGI 63066]MCX2679788.1 alpha/beta hydrolase [Galbibacter sp. EGI 63066]
MKKAKKIYIYLRMLGLLILLPAIANAKDTPEIPDGWSDGYVYANGIRIHYYHAVPAPEKPVIVMVHGVTDIGLSWTTLTWKLQDSYNIYMLDARGHGLSDPFTPADDGNTLVKDVVGFVRAMNFEKPILMGHSMGAATVMRVGAEYPDLAKAIIMLDPGLGPRGPRPRRNTEERDTSDKESESNEAKSEKQEPEPLSVSMFGPPETLVAQNNYNYEKLVETCKINTPKWDLVDCQYWALSKKQYHGAYSDETWQAMSGTMRTGESLAKILVPALILKADASPEQRKVHKEAVSVMQNGKLVHIDDAGHNLHHDQLERTVEVLNGFLYGLKQ